MLFDIGAASDQCSAWLTRSKPIRAVIRNPFITALVVTALVFAILYALIGAPIRSTRWQTLLRGAIYSVIAVTLVMVAHNYVTACDARERTRDSAAANILAGIENNLGAVPVVIGSGPPPTDASRWGAAPAEALLPAATPIPQTAPTAPAAPAAAPVGGAMTPIPLPVDMLAAE